MSPEQQAMVLEQFRREQQAQQVLQLTSKVRGIHPWRAKRVSTPEARGVD